MDDRTFWVLEICKIDGYVNGPVSFVAFQNLKKSYRPLKTPRTTPKLIMNPSGIQILPNPKKLPEISFLNGYFAVKTGKYR